MRTIRESKLLASILLVLFVVVSCTSPVANQLSPSNIVKNPILPALNQALNPEPSTPVKLYPDYKIKAVRTTASGAIERLFQNPVFTVTASVPLGGPSGDQISCNVGDIFTVTAIINTNSGPVLDLQPININPAGIVNQLGVIVNGSGTTATLQCNANGSSTVTFSSAQFGMYFEVHITVGGGGPPPPPAPSIQFTNATYNANEGAPTLDVTLSRTVNLAPAVSIQVSLAGGTATGGAALPADFNNTAFPVTVNWGAADGANKTVSIPLFDDVNPEPGETINLQLGAPTGGAVMGAQFTATATIIDNDNAPEIAFTNANFSANENVPTLDVTLQRTVNIGPAVSVQVTITGGTATGGAAAPNDYNNTAFPVTVNWGAADGANKTVSIPLFDDLAVEANETILLQLAGPTGGAILGAQSTATATINDDDVPGAPEIAFTSATFNANENAPTLDVTLQRTVNLAPAVSIQVSVTGGTATGGAAAPNDYNNTAFPVTVNWGAADGANKTVSIPLFDDPNVEPDETILLQLAGPTGGAVVGGQATATATIVNDDLAPSIQFTSATFNANENVPTLDLTLSRTINTGPAVSVQVSITGGTATGGAALPADFNNTAFPVTVNWAAADGANKTVNIPLFNDVTPEVAETILLQLGAPTGGAVLGAQSTTTATINDDDSPPEIAFTSATFNANENVPTLDVTLQRTVNTGPAVSVQVNLLLTGTATGGAAAPNDFNNTAFPVTVNWAAADGANKTVSIPLFDDVAVEGNETIDLQLAGPTGGAILGAQATATATINDDDAGTGTVRATTTNITFGVPAAPAAVKSLGINEAPLTAPAATVFVNPGGTITLQANAYDNPGNVVAGVVDFAWRFASISPVPGSLRYPAGPVGTPNNQAEITVIGNTGSHNIIVESLSSDLSANINVQVNDVQPLVNSFSINPAPTVDCGAVQATLPQAADTNCNVTLAQNVIYTFTAQFQDDNRDIVITEPAVRPIGYQFTTFAAPAAQENIAPPGNAFNVYVSGFDNGGTHDFLINFGGSVYGFAFSGGTLLKSYTSTLRFSSTTTGAVRMKIDTGSGQVRNHTWNITVP